MKILLIEPFFTGSHQSWALGYQQYSQHTIKILSLPGRHWKWRMYGGAVELAAQARKLADFQPDLLLATDMLDVTTFLALCPKEFLTIPVALYFHENQITYPWSSTDPDITLQRNNQYGFINYTSALAADALYFNSSYHRQAFLDALPTFLGQFPDFKGLEYISSIQEKSSELPLGINLKRFDSYQKSNASSPPLLVWNHRWEYDKNPTAFFKTLFRLKEEEIPFQVAILGQSYSKKPPIFEEAKAILTNQIVQYGAVDTFEEYARWLCQADIIPVTNVQDFFGQSVVEAIYCNCYPILPKRLAYPMHIPSQDQAAHFYESDQQLYELLKDALLNIDRIRNQSVQHYVSHYDWRILAPQYDEVFAKLV